MVHGRRQRPGSEIRSEDEMNRQLNYMTHLVNQGRLDLLFPLAPPNKDEDDSEGGSVEGTSGGGWSGYSGVSIGHLHSSKNRSAYMVRN